MAAPVLEGRDRDQRTGEQGVVPGLRRQPDAGVEPAVPNHEGARPDSARNPTLNLNRRGPLFWPTTSVITEVVPEKKFAFRIPINTTVWSYELEPTATGTKLTETRHAENGVTAISAGMTKTAFGGMEPFEKNWSRE